MPGLTPETDKLLREYLGLKEDERKRGFTNEQVVKLVKDFTEGFQQHIEDDRREFAAIHKRLDSHHARIETIESREPEMKPIPINTHESLVPPPISDTGSHHIDPLNWQKVTTYVEKLQHDNDISEGVKKTLKKERDELKEKLDFWTKVGAATIAIIAGSTGLFEFLSHHWH